ncbi:MAG: nucleotidyl transferase AbiEii/AbiGii toxin family protein [Nocardioides sp.]|uniref:nucleotidyl transferase AbiEii/AbiGii toxin family protein n=1 Tax=Nocardioides sp. TaxID=35761 RepID=UPI0039E39EBE
MTSGPITLTLGWLGRHTPPGAGVDGRRAAEIDIAQDLLLRELHQHGVLEALVFKGGTSLRKLYAGNQGRFSLDLDFSVADPASDPDTVVLELIGEIEGLRVGPFTYGIAERRGKWWLTIDSDLNDEESGLASKIDVSPPPWLTPVRRGWVPMPVHNTYGEPGQPELQVIRLEENIAEKVSRLNRTTTARDLYDLAWLATHQRDVGVLDTDLIRRLAVLKIWVDAHGVSSATCAWRPGHEPRSFDPDQWLRTRGVAEVDLDDIGALAVPTPSLDDLNATINAHFGFLRELDSDEKQLATARQQDRPLALRLLAELPGYRLANLGIY